MDETQNENLDSTNEEVQVDTEESTDVTESEDTVDVEQLQATNKKLYERAKKAETELKTLRKPSTLSENKTNSIDTITLYEQVALLKNIEQDEMDSLESDAKEIGVPVVKYIKSTAGKTRLESIRQEKKSKDASPEIGNSSPVFKKYTQSDLNKMSSAELEKILPHAS